MAHDSPVDIVIHVGEESFEVARGERVEDFVDFIRCGVSGGHFCSTNRLLRDEISELVEEYGSGL
jgi:hypothetical protein